jgi:hypothetical protein
MASFQAPLTQLPTKAPNLQVPPKEYSQDQMNYLVNQLKLYFVANDNNNAQLIQESDSLTVNTWLNAST